MKSLSTQALTEQRENACQLIRTHKLVAIIRLAEQSDVANVVECLVKGGVKILEITSNTPGFTEEISKAKALYPDILIGAGTIINEALATKAIAAGAQFLVTPNTHQGVVNLAHQSGLPVLMGALTPTEIANAHEYGADFVKIFPAGAMGVKYFNDLSGPFKQIDLIAVGGVNVDNLSQWFQAGAVGVGVGNDLTQAARTEQEKVELISHVKKYIGKLS
ncbi:bifunctional 4-hydroxy-2-oxoglutarate aldolase/2-dehydro-3-deoxy-phosphogluconate aldolase [Thalassotalea agariperforans]